MNGIIVDVIKPRKIGALKYNLRIPVLEPDPATWRTVAFIDRNGGHRMKVAEKFRQRFGIQRFPKEMIVVWKNRPRLQPPTVLFCKFQERVVQVRETLRSIEEGSLLEGR